MDHPSDASSTTHTCDSEYRAVTECERQAYSVGTVPATFQYHQIAGNSYIAGTYVFSILFNFFVIFLKWLKGDGPFKKTSR